MTDYERDLRAAVDEAYTAEGVTIWWRAHERATPETRRRMEMGVLSEWSGVIVDGAATEDQ